ncbi:MAG: Ldh family oxidoreductase, partial [Amphritea sp.]|nr:Ldh family oxidoreductase [Amphritea sp.]
MEQNYWLTLDEVHGLSREAAEACGASPENACALAASIAAAEAEGNRNVGLAHLPDYCDGMLAGRINADAVATFEQSSPVLFRLNAHSGLVHPAFDQHYDTFLTAARTYGIAAFSVSNAFTCGVVGYFVRRLADDGLIALAASNAGPAKVTVPGACKPVFGTNLMAFAVPGNSGAAMVIDQSSSATAFVNVRAASEAGEQLPQGWAVDAEGKPTQDPDAALEGALLAFGGYKGTNIALMVEMLSAGLT